MAPRVELGASSRLLLWVAAGLAVAFLTASFNQPIWRMKLRAPQYPKGLELVAYGTRIEGDLREINIINHYVGMEKIESAPAPEMRLYPVAVWALILLCVVAPLHRRLAWLAAAATLALPIAILADLQWWLHRFGRNLDPGAPFRLEPFTPLALGASKIGQFETSATLSWGLLAMIAAGLVLIGALVVSRGRTRPAAARAVAAAALGLLAAPVLGQGPTALDAESQRMGLQARIDATPPGGTLLVEGGVHHGPVTIEGPKRILGRGRPLIDGGGRGSVVTLTGDDVVFAGFEVRRGGRTISQEPAGIKVEGSGHRVEDNLVRDVYFGIHLARGKDNLVRGNRVEPGIGTGVRPGHGISVWYVSSSRIADNVVAAARDGIYFSFSDDLVIAGNEVSGSRYGMHSMFSQRADLHDNHIHDNLLGVALMNSAGLLMRDNTIARHRTGATAYGVLLKDIDDLVLEGNRIVDNRVGIYADSTPLGAGREALVTGNLIAGNGAALALQSNVRLVFTGNRVADNLVDLRAEGARVSDGNQWSRNGRGNFWSEYRGYDAEGDGIGDLPYRYEQVMNELLRRNPAAQAFLLTPAHLALEHAARLFPLVRPSALLVDEYPLVGIGR
ncbi:MAG TPA: nitrous oxide reductase family maturation protein NosD [Thermoanaerobaculia bacterium]|nr:nitrous oxide reductase family maturation protein NosD [Thermoanaerobaculia bacterium]